MAEQLQQRTTGLPIWPGCCSNLRRTACRWWRLFFTFFFHLEIETDKRLYQGLSFHYLRKLATSARERAFAEFARTLTTLAAQGQRWQDALTTGLEQLHQGQEKLHAGQEKMQATLEEFRAEMRQANDRKRRGVSFANDGEEKFLRQALERFRQLPPEMQSAHDRADLAACLGDAGLYDLAREEHDKAAKAAQREKNDALAAAEHFQAYRDATEKEQWKPAKVSAVARGQTGC